MIKADKLTTYGPITIIADNGKSVECICKNHRRAKRVKVCIDSRDGKVFVTVPTWPRPSEQYVRDFLQMNANKLVESSESFSTQYPIEPYAEIPYFGKWIKLLPTRGPKAFKLDSYIYGVEGPNFEESVKDLLKEKLLEFVQRRCWEHAKTLDVELADIRIANLGSAWGRHLNPSDDIEIDWRIVGAPASVIDCTCAHEVAHIIEQNHSKAFWYQVYKCVPEHVYKREHAKLKPINLGKVLRAVGTREPVTKLPEDMRRAMTEQRRRRSRYSDYDIAITQTDLLEDVDNHDCSDCAEQPVSVKPFKPNPEAGEPISELTKAKLRAVTPNLTLPDLSNETFDEFDNEFVDNMSADTSVTVLEDFGPSKLQLANNYVWTTIKYERSHYSDFLAGQESQDLLIKVLANCNFVSIAVEEQIERLIEQLDSSLPNSALYPLINQVALQLVAIMNDEIPDNMDCEEQVEVLEDRNPVYCEVNDYDLRVAGVNAERFMKVVTADVAPLNVTINSKHDLYYVSSSNGTFAKSYADRLFANSDNVVFRVNAKQELWIKLIPNVKDSKMCLKPSEYSCTPAVDEMAVTNEVDLTDQLVNSDCVDCVHFLTDESLRNVDCTCDCFTRVLDADGENRKITIASDFDLYCAVVMDGKSAQATLVTGSDLQWFYVRSNQEVWIKYVSPNEVNPPSEIVFSDVDNSSDDLASYPYVHLDRAETSYEVLQLKYPDYNFELGYSNRVTPPPEYDFHTEGRWTDVDEGTCAKCDKSEDNTCYKVDEFNEDEDGHLLRYCYDCWETLDDGEVTYLCDGVDYMDAEQMILVLEDLDLENEGKLMEELLPTPASEDQASETNVQRRTCECVLGFVCPPCRERNRLEGFQISNEQRKRVFGKLPTRYKEDW